MRKVNVSFMKILRSIIIVVIPIFGFGQTTPDLTQGEVWLGTSYKLKFENKLTVQLEEQIRLDNDIDRLKKSFTELSLGYEVFKDFEVGFKYRFSIFPNSFAENAIDRSAFNISRISIDASYELDKKGFPLSLEYRTRFQDAKEHYTGQKITFWRNKFTLEWEASKNITPFIEYENFYRLNRKNEFRQNRYTAGIEWRINKEMDLSTFYRVDEETNKKLNGRQNIIGIMFSYSMDYKKKEKKAN